MALLGEIFFPGRPIDDVSALVGRKHQIRQALAILATPGGVPIILGPQAIGKSSLVTILMQAMVGERGVLETLKLEDCAPSSLPRIAIYFRVSESIANANELCAEISKGMSRALKGSFRERRYDLKEFTLETSLSAGIASARLSGNWVGIEEKMASPAEVLAERMRQFREECGIEEVVVFLDECEQLAWLDQLLDFVRSFDDEKCRFVIALREYAAGRLADPSRGDYRLPSRVFVRALTREDGEDIFKRAYVRLENIGIVWRLTDDALNYILTHSAGEPWYHQMIGNELLFDPIAGLERYVTPALKMRYSQTVNLEAVRRAERSMVSNRLRGLHGRKLALALNGSVQLEELLLSLALYPQEQVPLEFIQHIKERRISGASRKARGLSHGGDSILIIDDEQRIVQFRDHQMKIFLSLREASSPVIEQLAREHVNTYI